MSMMTETPGRWPFRLRRASDPVENQYTIDALQRHKREGMELATRARLIMLAVIAVMLPFLVGSWDVLYFEVFLGIMALNGLAQRHVGRVGRSGAELALLFLDLALLTFVLVYPPPFWKEAWPHAMTYRFDNFTYFYVILAAGTLSYNWRTIMAIGHWGIGMWAIGLGLLWYFGTHSPELGAAAEAAFGHEDFLIDLLDPNSFELDIRLQEMVVFLLITYTLALSVARFERLLHNNAALERERTNLSRYFSPNVVADLSQNDMPLREVREQEVAVLFVDLVGFTRFAANRPGREVIETLRAFHQRMEACVFEAEGTLDKYLGDGLMATFGTPLTRTDDTGRALQCARAMLVTVDALNGERKACGEEELQVSIGLHFGPVVLGDIGVNRLEFAVIGNTVNVASRMEGLTRNLATRVVLSAAAHVRAKAEGEPLTDFQRVDGQEIRGLPGAVRVWALNEK